MGETTATDNQPAGAEVSPAKARRKPPSGPVTHGAYSLMRRVAQGKLDLRTRAGIALKALQAELAVSLGSIWQDLSSQQRLLVSQVALKALVCQQMMEYALASGVMTRRGRLITVLGKNYLAWSNSLRLDLQALGLERRAKDVIDVAAALASLPAPPQDGRHAGRGTLTSTQSADSRPGAADAQGGAS